MGVIFYLSHQQAVESNSLSTGITERIVAIIERVTFGVEIDLVHFNHLIRKSAHFFAYLVLGVLVSNALNSHGYAGFKLFWVAMVICVLYAISDEVHQLFVPGRAGQVRDVLIDSAGAVVGIGGFLAVLGLSGRLRKSDAGKI